MTDLWPWALAAYARPGVAEECLRLQDDAAQNVPLLLWAVWSAEAVRAPDLAAGARLTRAWDAEAVAPLRRLRRALKAASPTLGDADRQAVRDQIGAVELNAERRLLLALEALPPAADAPVQRSDRADLLAAASRAWGAPLAPSAFAELLRGLNPDPF